MSHNTIDNGVRISAHNAASGSAFRSIAVSDCRAPVMRESGTLQAIAPLCKQTDVKAAAAPCNRLRVLVVDDEQEFVATLVKRLSKRGMVCATAFTGAEAIEIVSREAFDVVLLDMKLPDFDGNEVLREVKKMKPDTQVVILTGHISASDGREGIGDGAHDYLMKPVEFESLLESLQRASQSKGLLE